MGVPLSQPAQPPNTDPAPAPPNAGPSAPNPTPPAGAPQPPAAVPSAGFPADTPLSEMTADQQISYWKFHSRKHEDSVRDLRNQYADYDAIKAQAADAARLRQQVETDAEKALREATENARKTALDEFSPRLVAAEFRAASAGRIESDRLATLTEDIDMSRYLKADGSVDLDKVSAKVDAWAPKPAPPDPNAPPPPPRGVKPDHSQGARGGKVGLTGREMYEARHPKRTPSST